MAKRENSAPDAQEPDSEQSVHEQPTSDAPQGPGASAVGVLGIVAISAYLVLLAMAMIYALVVLWPTPPPARQAQPASTVTAPQGAAGQSGSEADSTPKDADAARPGPPSGDSADAGRQTGDRRTDQGTVSGALQSPARCPGEPCRVSLFGWRIWIWDEQRLLLIVVLAGALGSIVHALRSVYWYVGNRTLVRSWLAMYLLLPLAGATLALIFYFVVRGGFFSPQSSFEQTSPFGFAAFATLIGMFSQQAVLKLQSVAETLLTKPEPGANATPQDAKPPQRE